MDIYSYGMVLWEIAAREIPFADAQDELTVISWIKDGEKEVIPADCPKAYGDIIQETWREAKKRPSAERILMVLTQAQPKPTSDFSQKTKKAYVQKSWHFDPATERNAALAKDL
jgi:Protein tyrosine and serine/threonine kinase